MQFLSRIQGFRAIFLNFIPGLLPLMVFLTLHHLPAKAEGRPSQLRSSRLVVEFRSGISERKRQLILKRHRLTELTSIPSLSLFAVGIPGRTPSTLLIAKLKAQSEVRSVEADRRYKPASFTPDLQIAALPLEIEAEADDSLRVALVDSGISKKELSQLITVTQGWNTHDNSADTSDPIGHGSAMLEDIARAAASQGREVTVTPIRAGDQKGFAYSSAIASGISVALERNAKLIKIGYAVSRDPLVLKAARLARARGAKVLCARPDGSSVFLVRGSAETNNANSPDSPENFSQTTELLLQFKDSVPPVEQAKLLDAWKLDVKELLPEANAFLVTMTSGDPAQTIAVLTRNPKIEFAGLSTSENRAYLEESSLMCEADEIKSGELSVLHIDKLDGEGPSAATSAEKALVLTDQATGTEYRVVFERALDTTDDRFLAELSSVEIQGRVNKGKSRLASSKGFWPEFIVSGPEKIRGKGATRKNLRTGAGGGSGAASSPLGSAMALPDLYEAVTGIKQILIYFISDQTGPGAITVEIFRDWLEGSGGPTGYPVSKFFDETSNHLFGWNFTIVAAPASYCFTTWEVEDWARSQGINVDLYRYRASYQGCNSYTGSFSGEAMVTGTFNRALIGGAGRVGDMTHLGLKMIVAHEIAHMVWFPHSNTYPGKERSDFSDIMGRNLILNHLNAPNRAVSGWIPNPESNIVTVSQSGRYEIAPLALNPNTTGLPQVIKISRRPAFGQDMYLSYRTGIGMDCYGHGYSGFSGSGYSGNCNDPSAAWLNGVSLHYYPGIAGFDPCTVCVRDASYELKLFRDGEVFYDEFSGTTIKQVSHSANSAVIEVSFAPTGCTYAKPGFTISPQSQTGTGGSLQFPWTFTDNDARCFPAMMECGALELPAGWTSSTYTFSGNFSYSWFGITPAADADSGTYTIKVGCRDRLSGLPLHSIETSVNYILNAPGTPGCYKRNPTLAIDPPATFIASGGTGRFTVTLTNNDSGPNCQPVTYNLKVSSNWSATTAFSSPSLLLAPGQSATSTLSASTGAGLGNASLFVSAADAAWSQRTVSKTVTLNVSSSGQDIVAPATQVVVPANGATVRGTTPLVVTALDDVRISKVELYRDGQLYATSATAPYRWYVWNWNTAAEARGAHTFYSKAYDLSNNVTTSGSITVNVDNGPDITLPVASITSPAAGQTVSGLVPINVSATDNIAVAKVEFYKDNVLLGTDTAEPYSFSWNTSSETAAAHTLYAKAYDTASNMAVSAPVSVTVKTDITPPSVSIVSPANGQTVSGPVAVNAGYSDNVGVIKIEFYRDGVLFSTDASAPYYTTWDSTSVLNGTHTLQLKGYDAADNVGTSALVTVTVQNGPTGDSTPPSTAITYPQSGITVSGPISVTANAADNVGVTKVELYKNGSLFSTDTSSPFSFYWNTASEVNGSYTLQTRAYDAAGNIGTSTVIGVTVSNSSDTTAPIVRITSPAGGAALPRKGSVTISTTASDNIGVTEIDILFDNVLKMSCYSASSCAYKLNSAKVPSGTHTITVKALDAAGNIGSQSISVSKQ